jgi:hypothetical protein
VLHADDGFAELLDDSISGFAEAFDGLNIIGFVWHGLRVREG